MSKSGKRSDAKASQSKSKSRRGNKSNSRTSTISDETNGRQQSAVMPELGEKLRRINADQNGNNVMSISHSLPRRSHRGSSSRKSYENPSSSVMNKELENKMERMQRGGSGSTSGRRQEASRQQSRRSSSSTKSDGRSRRHSRPTDAADTPHRRGHNGRRTRPRQQSSSSDLYLKPRVGSDSNLGDDETAASSSSFNEGSLPDLAIIPSEGPSTQHSTSQESTSQGIASVGTFPGAFRVSNVGEVGVPSSSLDETIHGDEDEDSDIQTNSISTGTTTTTTGTTIRPGDGASPRSGTINTHSRSHTTSRMNRSALRSVSEEQGTMVEAVAARDHEDELEEARQRGREEALEEVTSSRTHHTAEIAVAMPTDDDDDDAEGESKDDGKRKSRNAFCRALICLGMLLILSIVVTTVVLPILHRSKPEVSSQLDENEESNAKVVVVYTPPTQEECEAIATGIILDDQLSLVHKSFYIHYDITLASDEDLAPLFNAMMRHIQENLIPIMAGCGATDFLGTPIALDDGLKNATNAIVNGKVAKESEASCSSDGSSDNCRSYVLLLDLYLNEEKTSSSLIEVIRDSVNGEELAEALGFQFPGVDMEVNVPLIVPTIDATVVPSTSYDLVTAVPTQAPTRHPHHFEPSRFVSRTVSPTMGLPVTSPGTTSSPSMMPISPSLLSFEPTKGNGQSSSSTNEPSRATTTPPMQMVTPSPSDDLSNTLTASPTRRPTSPSTSLPTPPPTLVGSKPTKAPTRHPTRSPTRSPTLSPSMIVTTIAPTPEISKSPTESPSSSPSLSTTPAPTKKPTLAPTNVPSSIPSKLSTSAPSVLPSKAPTLAPTTTAGSGGGAWCCSQSYKTCDITHGACNVNQFACEDSCLGTWIQENSCTGLARWSECTNDVTGCCAPAVCTNQGPTYKQCL
ncbi:unnamed protein product [Cylindrotheca closterium]|uniref:Uncharacterized protein n=1 Tax=Cylindrotheca closterium TaxID=2856 RepID=A0AAD2FYJ1_9STRA|nr:unnamed protein product [Cylindrotheca closterium]